MFLLIWPLLPEGPALTNLTQTERFTGQLEDKYSSKFRNIRIWEWFIHTKAKMRQVAFSFHCHNVCEIIPAKLRLAASNFPHVESFTGVTTISGKWRLDMWAGFWYSCRQWGQSGQTHSKCNISASTKLTLRRKYVRYHHNTNIIVLTILHMKFLQPWHK